jgi:hypothetical protein
MKRKSLYAFQTEKLERVLGAVSSEAKRQRREVNKSSPSSVEIKKSGNIPPLPHMVSWRGA